jgi:DNA-binding transcriptional LysR family regulator
MELEHLRIFAAAAESGSFSRAAARLYISHSTVSRAVAALETELDAVLFLRDSRGVALTGAGEELLLGGRELLALSDGLKERIAKREGEKICKDGDGC